jgi:hypothetical protein
MKDDERHEMRVIAAQAIIALNSAPYTLRSTKAIMQLERLLPPSGTPEYRAAYAEAHGRSGECE